MCGSLTGSLFAVMGAMRHMGELVSAVASNKVYAGTLYFMEGFIFLLQAMLECVSLAFIMWVQNGLPGFILQNVIHYNHVK